MERERERQTERKREGGGGEREMGKEGQLTRKVHWGGGRDSRRLG